MTQYRLFALYKKQPCKQCNGRLLSGVAYMLGLFSSIALVRFFDLSAYVWLMGIAAIILILTNRFKLRFTLFHAVWISAAVTFATTQSMLSEAYWKNDFNGLMALTLIALVSDSLFASQKNVDSFMAGILLAGKIQIVWIFLQFILNFAAGVDLNQLIFNDILHMATTTSQYKASGLVATGLCWNAGGIAAVLLAQYVFEKKGHWRVFAVIAGLLTQSSTIAIGLSACILFSILGFLFTKQKQLSISKSSALCIALLIIFICFTFLAVPSVQDAIRKVVEITINRISMLMGSQQYDSSFEAHFNYYVNLPELLGAMSIVQMLFGYGIDCSGLPYTALTSQYWWLDSWFLESDPMNSLLGIGIVGTVILYSFLFSLIIKAFRNQNYRAVILIVSYILCGFFYDIQSVIYYWLIMLEICLSKYVINKEKI